MSSPFIHWFKTNGGLIDVSCVGIKQFPASDGGRGAVALKDIPEGFSLFTVPRSLILSTRTSSLPPQFGVSQWKVMKMDDGWTGLILCMMWEATRGTSSKWFEYLNTLPARFNTPMFWGEDDLAELEGTSVVEKIGRTDAEKLYEERLLPAIQSRPDLFPSNIIATHYSLEVYHIMGSRILSRSFNVENWDSGEEEEGNTVANTSQESGMDVDVPEALDSTDEFHGDRTEQEDDDDAGDNSDFSEIAMVPMADMLNARYGSENAKLFYEEHELKMVSTKPIKAGEQIWNTYGDLPNSELLRRYGHVDLLPLSQDLVGNPGDVVEIRADIVVSAVARCSPSVSSDSYQERIDWWLEEGGDDVFFLESDLDLPQAMVSLVRLLLFEDEWEKARNKGKPPRPKVDKEVLNIVVDVLITRLRAYPTALEEDVQALCGPISMNKRHSIIVRLGEKRLLNDALIKTNRLHAADEGKKRKGSSGAETTSMKKTKR